MSGHSVRSKFMRRFIGLEKYSRLIAWSVVAFYIAQILGAMVVGHLLLNSSLSWLSIVGMVALAIFIGTRMRGLNNIVHECSHATFTVDRNDNYVLGSLCASIVMGCFGDYRDEHLSHHAHLGDYDKDMDLQGIRDLRLHEPLTTATILRHLTNPFLGRHLPHYAGINLSARDGRFFFWFKIGQVIATCILLLVAPITAIFFVLVPFLLVYSTLNYWTDCMDHAGIVCEADELDASRNILAPMPLRALFFPRNDCFHLVHHLFPQIPARHLDAAHQELLHDLEYRSRTHAIRPAHTAVARLVTKTS